MLRVSWFPDESEIDILVIKLPDIHPQEIHVKYLYPILAGILIYSQTSAAPDFSLVGYAAGVTGGEGGRTVSVNNASAFKSNCQSSEKLIIQVTGKISNASTSIGSNKTIIGVGASGEITRALVLAALVIIPGSAGF